MRTIAKLIVVVALFVGAISAGSAVAAKPSEAVVTLSPTSGPIGTAVDVRGLNWKVAKGTQGTVTFDGQVVGTFTVQSNRTWNGIFLVPGSATPGDHTVVSSAGTVSVTSVFTVTG